MKKILLNGALVKHRQKYRTRDIIDGYLFLLPVILGLLFFTLWPILYSFYISFTEFDNVSPAIWVGGLNYVKMFKNSLFVKSIGVTIIYAVVSVPLGLFLSFFLAYMLNRDIKGMKVYRAIFYAPVIIPTVASSLIFRDLFDPTYGYINSLITSLGLPPYTFFSEPETALPSLIMYSMWGMGSSMLIWLAGFHSIPTALFEVAEIEGAKWYHRLIWLVIPLSTPMIFYNLIMAIIGSLQSFGQVYILTNGGPRGATTTIVLMIYNYGFRYFEMGVASAMAWFLFAIIFVLTLITFKTSKWVYYGDEQ